MSPKTSAHLLEPKPSTALQVEEEINPASYGSPQAKNRDKFSKTDTNELDNLVKNHPINR